MAALLWNLKAKFFHLNTTQISLHDVESYKLSVRREYHGSKVGEWLNY